MNELTVAICAYNCERYIEETLGCIVNQTFQDFDLLIINDCSTDDSQNIIEMFLTKKNRQYKIVNFDINKGLAYGRHFVETNVETKYLLFVDSDDCPYPTMVEKLYNKIISDGNLMAVGCFLEYMDSDGNKISGGQFLGDKTKDDFYKRAEQNKLIFLGSNAIFNRELALSVGGRAIFGFFEGKPRFQDLCEDLDLWTRMSDLYLEAKAIIVIPEILMKYRKHEQGLSASSFNMILRMRHIKKNLLLRREGATEQTFVEFYNSLTEKEMSQLKRKSKAADTLRNAAFFFKKGKIFSASFNIINSIIAEPSYLWQKIKSNSGLFK